VGYSTTWVSENEVSIGLVAWCFFWTPPERLTWKIHGFWTNVPFNHPKDRYKQWKTSRFHFQLLNKKAFDWPQKSRCRTEPGAIRSLQETENSVWLIQILRTCFLNGPKMVRFLVEHDLCLKCLASPISDSRTSADPRRSL
jgi:hypothetical protein